jgi:hypothetical protein
LASAISADANGLPAKVGGRTVHAMQQIRDRNELAVVEPRAADSGAAVAALLAVGERVDARPALRLDRQAASSAVSCSSASERRPSRCSGGARSVQRGRGKPPMPMPRSRSVGVTGSQQPGIRRAGALN